MTLSLCFISKERNKIMMMYYILLQFDILERKIEQKIELELHVFRINTAILNINIKYYTQIVDVNIV